MKNRALILVDLQNDYFPNGRFVLSNILPAAENAARLLAFTRSFGDLVVHVRHEFETMDAPFFVPGSDGAQINPIVQDREDEIVVLKHHANSFRGTNLNELLSSNGVTDLEIVGAMSHMCIHATARAAADLGYNVAVIHDAVATRDLEFRGIAVPAAQVQAAFMAALGSGYAVIRSADEQLRLHQVMRRCPVIERSLR